MLTAKVFTNGRSQAVRLPKSCRFEDSEVQVKKIGNTVVLYPKNVVPDAFYEAVGNFTDDYFEAIEELRKEDRWQEREPL
jgi:antitoxin VapB